MIIFGLTGGIASGKSYVADLLGRRGARVLDADRHAHNALAEAEVQAAIRERWGASVFTTAGELDRKQIAARVFGESEAADVERAFLEGLIHPRVRQALRDELAKARADLAPAAVLDIPLLHEARWAGECDAVLFVDTPRAVREARAADRGWSPAELAERESAQLSISEKRSHADAVIPGDDPEAAQAAVHAVWDGTIGGK